VVRRRAVMVLVPGAGRAPSTLQSRWAQKKPRASCGSGRREIDVAKLREVLEGALIAHIGAEILAHATVPSRSSGRPAHSAAARTWQTSVAASRLSSRNQHRCRSV